MIDFLDLWDQIMTPIQTIATWSVMLLLAAAGACFILRHRKWAIDCVILAAVIMIVALVLKNALGLDLLNLGVIGDLFDDVFEGVMDKW